MMQTGFEGQDGSGMVGNMGASGNMTTSFDPEAKTSGSDGVIHTAGKNKPTNPSLWARAKAAAKKKFDVYPSAYANGWAVQWYKKHGGGWKK